MEARLNLLCDAGIIDRDIYHGMTEVVRLLEVEWGIPVRSEQGEMAITHMANALMRSRRGEEVAPLDADLLSEITDSAHWPQVSPIHRALLAQFDVTLHPNEEGYLMANLFGLWMARLG